MQQNTSAMWAAIILLAALAGVFGVMSFNAQQDIQSLTDKLRNADPQNIASEYDNQKVKDFVRQNLALTQDIQALNDNIKASRQETGDANLKFENQRAVTARREEQIAELNTRIANQQKVSKTDIERMQSQFDAEIRKRDVEIANYRKWSDDYQRESADLKKKNEDNLSALDTIVAQGERDRQTLAIRINALIQRLTTSQTTEGVSGKAKAYDGNILVADIKNNTVQINIGSLNKVRQGMRFQVVRNRYNREDVMGEIEVTRVGRTTSEAMILVKSAPLKLDPYSGWTTDDPNAKYSPYSTMPQFDPDTGLRKEGDGLTNQVVPLITIDQRDVNTMNPLDPILVGDHIVNPLFTPDRVMHFVHIGYPIFLSRESIRAGVEDYGGVLEPEGADVDSTTDYLIVSAIPREADVANSEEAIAQRKRMLDQEERAKQFGVAIIREAEFSNFVNN